MGILDFFEKVDNRLWRVNYPVDRMLFSDEYNFVYCPIPKVASSSFHDLIFRLNGLERRDYPDKSRNDLAKKLGINLASLKRWKAENILMDKSYIKFVFVRNPYHRLVAAYLDKFVRKKAYMTLPVIDWIYKNLEVKEVDFEKSVSFRQFVEYVSCCDDGELDKHWQPQSYFLGGVEFDFIGKLETITEDFSRLHSLLKLPESVMLEKTNSAYGGSNRTTQTEVNRPVKVGNIELSELKASELAGLPAFPEYAEFYTIEILEMVTQRYCKDIANFQYPILTIE